MAIASKIQHEQLVVIDELSFDAPRTGEMASILDALGLRQGSTLVTTEAYDPNVYKSARNIARVTVSPVSDLNALSVLTPRRMLVTKAALDVIKRRFAAAVTGAQAAQARDRDDQGEGLRQGA
jgi:large subunit ribosomal protein L4